MQLETLEYLLAIADAGSARKAADHLNTSFQNVSRVLLQAESEWGVQLFQRTPKGMQPTEQGALALSTARAMLDLYEQMLEQFHYHDEMRPDKPNTKIKGTLQLVSSMMINNAFLNDVLLEFSIHYPNVQVVLAEEDAYRVEMHPDCHIYLAPRTANELSHATLTVTPLLTDRMVLLAKETSPFAQQNSISLKRMAQLPLVLLAKQHWEQSTFGHIIAANQIKPKNAIFTSSIIGFQKYIASGQYVGLATDIIARKMKSDKRLDFKIIPFREKNVELIYCMATQNGVDFSAPEKCFIDFVKESFHLHHT